MSYSENQSLDDYIKMFENIYEPIQNQERNFYQVFARLIEAIAECSQYVNKGKQNGLAANLPDVFSWYSSLIIKARMSVSLEKALWKKFPYICPYCLHSPCQCARGKKSLEDNSQEIEKKAKDNEDRKPKTLSEWQDMFDAIYPRDPQSYDQIKNFSHLIEELGETSEAYRVRYFVPSAIENELSDVFTWIIGMANLLRANARDGNVLGYSDYNLQSEVYKKYCGKCPNCKKVPCICISKESKIKISERNIIYPEEIMIAIDKMKTEISSDLKLALKQDESREIIDLIKRQIDSNDITDQKVNDILKKIVIEPSHKKWYQQLTASGFAENAIVSALTIVVQQLFNIH
jgi:NTP pyrophosphatase (non-canonical NTP hydrolase)